MSERTISTLLRSCAAGLGAVSAREAAVTVFHAGGRHLLDEGSRSAARKVVDLAASTALGALIPPGVGQLAGHGMKRALLAAQAIGGDRLAGVAGKVLTSEPVTNAVARLTVAAKGAAGQAVQQAADQMMTPGLRGRMGALARVAVGSTTDQIYAAARRSAGVGAVIDGVSSGIDASRAYQQGEITGRQAAVRVAIDAATGAVAAGAGVALGAGAVAVLGGLGAPALFAVGAAGSLGTKRALRWLFD